MKIHAQYGRHELCFKQASGTSRGVLKTKTTYFIKLSSGSKVGYGECGLLKGLSYDDVPEYEKKLQWACKNISLGLDQLWDSLLQFPSIQFGLEQAFLSLVSRTPFEFFPSSFTKGISTMAINGLVWMGDESFMKSQIASVIEKNFSCVKMKIGAIDLEKELRLLSSLRKQFSAQELEIRVDANGAFNLKLALNVMETLKHLEVHSIEQPLGVSDIEDLAILCQNPAIPVALDESLIGCIDQVDKSSLLDIIKPQYIVLKPSFIGGFRGSDQWILLAEQRNIGWWATSALESNVALNAISQWVFEKSPKMHQGLGTGSLYTNNILSPLYIKNGAIGYNPTSSWNTKLIDKLCT
ncbi:MAG: o-succinylbenzoate synthase [Flavobacteriaceae bacterium]|jgi:o-succinylbenzoate synthase